MPLQKSGVFKPGKMTARTRGPLVAMRPGDRHMVRTFGPKEGQCNICGEIGRLTHDHSPPKSVVRPTPVSVRHIVELVANDKPASAGRLSQNGLKFRTLCARCNNQLLGLKYDPALANFCNSLTSILSSSLTLPRTVNVRCIPQRIMRAVFGHLAAQGVERHLKGPQTEIMRDAFLDESILFPEGMRFYFWPFVHEDCVLFRDAAYSDIPTKKVFIIWLMKFFPVSFLIAWEDGPSPYFSLPRLCAWRRVSSSAEVDMPVPLVDLPPRYWPEAPTDRNVVMYGEGAMFATPHVRTAPT